MDKNKIFNTYKPIKTKNIGILREKNKTPNSQYAYSYLNP